MITFKGSTFKCQTPNEQKNKRLSHAAVLGGLGYYMAYSVWHFHTSYRVVQTNNQARGGWSTVIEVLVAQYAVILGERVPPSSYRSDPVHKSSW